MSSWVKAILWGLVVWLIPFVVAVLIFPLKQNCRPLFESIMPVTLAAVVVFCAAWYFRRVQGAFVRQGILLGVIWLGMSVLIDLPLMLSPPISMTPLDYAADVGSTYLIMPVITVGIAFAARNGGKASSQGESPCTPAPGSTAAPSGLPTPPAGR
jgi:hypothetical protein